MSRHREDDWAAELTLELKLLRKNEGLSHARVRACPTLCSLCLVRQRCAEDAPPREVASAALELLRGELWLFRQGERGRVLRRSFALDVQQEPHELGRRLRDIAATLSRERKAKSQPAIGYPGVRSIAEKELENFTAYLIEREISCRVTDRRPSRDTLRYRAPFEYVAYHSFAKYVDSRVPRLWETTEVIQVTAAGGLDSFLGRLLYTGDPDGYEVHYDGATIDGAFEPQRVATSSRLYRLCLPRRLAQGESHQIFRRVVPTGPTEPQPFLSVTPTAHAQLVRVTVAFEGLRPRDDRAEAFNTWSLDLPATPLADAGGEELTIAADGSVSHDFLDVAPGVAVGLKWEW